ncbi:alpha/beta hydrolase fold protein [Desulfarculus baarsii DSM 2075]|uniref:Alpha/beta hydrolase fold protein n=1 Tax=Desulfarculus baarsii (strain ATCC 33931 / DSM 2075 / LMG 7858 / VKM B-1802 / 2st14) TaxID=644282 RepID=E1QIQ4_DESB2|nr:alpha/beta fold hydrolase [Desulfarculus baarsii]ADK84477.1 alpha/beta hydrolase fold protein [Desulfarculus baarsii DSM 2075]
MNSPAHAYAAPLLLRGPMIQSILASSRLRVRNGHAMDRGAREVIVDAGGGVRLLGYHSPQPGRSAKGLVILLHGWEGCQDSVYMLRTGRALYDQGYDVFRLNLRDHGESHRLNQGLFLGTLIEESHQGVRAVAGLAQGGPVFLAGFSMGGNFALRMSLRHGRSPIPGLRGVAAISPGVNPEVSTRLIDKITLMRLYFLKKWKRSLRLKQEAFPQVYDFSEVLACRTVMGMTEAMLARYTDYPSTSAYFSGYALMGEALGDLAAPTVIVTAADDPVIPADDFRAMTFNDQTELIIHDHGGHSGFVEGLGLASWYERWLPQWFASLAGK